MFGSIVNSVEVSAVEAEFIMLLIEYSRGPQTSTPVLADP